MQLPAKPQSNRYASIDTMKRTDKVAALKNTRLKPYDIKSPYDELAHNFYLWTKVADDADKKHYTAAQKAGLAQRYYAKMLKPVYGKMGLESMSPELWEKQAFAQARGYRIEDAYSNSIVHDLQQGMYAGAAGLERGYERAKSMLGNTMDTAVQLWQKRAAERAQFAKDLKSGAAQKQYAAEAAARKATPWHEALSKLVATAGVQNKEIASIKHPVHMLSNQNIQVAPSKYGLQGTSIRPVNSETSEFWAAALPTHDGALHTLTSMVGEGIVEAPLFGVLSKTKTLVEGSNLSVRLMASPAGRKVMSYLLAGAEGAAFGETTRKQEDPNETWRSALSFAALNGVFDVGGMGLKKLADVAPEAWKDKIAARAEKFELGMKGLRKPTAAEQYGIHVSETANNLVVGGPMAQREIHAAALEHVDEMQRSGKSRAEIKAYEKDLINKDSALWAPVLSASHFVRSLMGEKNLSEMGAEDMEYISSRLNGLVEDAGKHLNTHTVGMSEAHTEEAVRNLKQPAAKHTLAYYQNKAVAEMAKNPAAAKLISKEQVQKYAEKLYADDMDKAAKQAEKVVGADPVTKAQSAAKRRKVAVPAMRTRSERKIGSTGAVSVRYSVTPDYRVQLTKHKKAAAVAGQSLIDYFKDLPDEEFEKDMSEYFYPKALSQAKIYFEHQHTREGLQNPNFLAFMYNYKEQMPKEFAEALREKLIESGKVQKFLKGRSYTEPQLDYYAKAMYNHVDNFLGSGHWPAERNLFRSSNESVFKTTKWQRQLLVEKGITEQHNLLQMFGEDPENLSLALSVHKKLSELRLDEFDHASLKRDSQTKIRSYDERMSTLQSITDDAERWAF
jgi:hypothetical protein